ncbi:D-alanyl-D-alanine carboxypeptidase family protein [Sinanaerobacter chloroacetimidivorans]|uniref:serine-type D-Ala-D-Ala carboxypeptidase n=1 Tax=Sinanaerobacter chloroacetimidivorans TaxID=2818044 RepID=A0A8J7W6G3_9FIRM|nr:D-alanyl-D-alanine carboxypeptidase family protein [Sinanaerobacter chloroacetimidivorans]MBR0600208.1 D-alanyl-D-alanine carboxypeptidase [Sinanaerobacter chloroacetimidivorans]
MRRIIISILLIALMGLFTPIYGEPALEKQVPEPPAVSAQNAIVIEADSGKVLYEKNADEKAYPASITKILTALLAIENGDLEKKVKVSQNAAGVEGSSIYLEKGEKIPLRDLVYGLMLRSGNDAAIAISEAIGGTTDNFVAMMNERAKEIGAVNTHFMNPNGLHHDEHYTTARDMALISREAMKNEEFKTVARAKSWITDRGVGKYNYFYNKNKVIYQYEGGTGIKIGYTKAAGRTLVASSERNGMELICVVLNAPDWFNDTYKLMDYVYNNYEKILIAPGQRPLKAVKVIKGCKDFVYVGPKQDITIPGMKETNSNISIEYVMSTGIKAPVCRWQKAGELKIYVNNEYIYSAPLFYLEDIDRK